MRSKKSVSIIILIAFVINLFVPIAIAANTQVEETNEITQEQNTEETIDTENTVEQEKAQTTEATVTKEEKVQEEPKTNYNTKSIQQTPVQPIAKQQDLENGIYKIKAGVGNNMYLDIDGGKTTNSANLQIWSASDVEQQQFRVTKLSNGNYKIIAMHSGKALDVAGGGTTNGTNVQQYDDNGTSSQQWELKKEGEYYTIVSECNKLNLDIAGGGTACGTNVQMYAGNGSASQKFQFEKATLDDGTYKIKAEIGNNMYLDIDGGKTVDNANLQIWSASDVAQQKFEVTYLNNGYYKIVASHSKKALDVDNSGKSNGTNVKQYQDYGSDAQQWKLKKEGDYYTVVSKCNNLNLDIAGGGTACGTNVQMYAGNGSASQKFKFEKVDATTPVKPPVEPPKEEPKVPTEPEQKPANLPDGTYQIKTKLNTGRVVDIVDGKENDGQNVQIWDNYDVKQQKYHIKNVGDGYYSIRAVHSKKALDVAGGAKANNTNVQQYTYNGTDAQLWKIVVNTDGSYSFISKCNGLYLDVQDAKGNNGDNIQVYQRNDAQDAQKFEITSTTFQEIDEGMYEIQMANNTNKVIDISIDPVYYGMQDGADVQVWDRANANQQKFNITYNLTNKEYTIQAVHSGKVLDVTNGEAIENARVQQFGSNNSAAQKWEIKDLGDGTYNIVSKCQNSGKYLDIENYNMNSAKATIRTKSGSDTQLFKIVKTSPVNGTMGDIEGIDENKYPGFKQPLRQLKAQYPNWDIKVLYTGLNWTDVINNEDVFSGGSPKNLTEDYYKYPATWHVGNARYDVSKNWFQSSRLVIEYMMDPRNSLDDKYGLQFMDLTSKSGNIQDIRNAITMNSNNFLNKESIMNAIYDAANTNNVNPLHLVTRINQEQGINGNSAMNGKRSVNGRQVFNLFNINVTGKDGLTNGANWAYEHGWFSQEDSIRGGAKFMKEKYINVGQNTLYFQKFNVAPTDRNNLYNHQYMQNVRAANDEANTMYQAYSKGNTLKTGDFKLIIPMYENMPYNKCPDGR